MLASGLRSASAPVLSQRSSRAPRSRSPVAVGTHAHVSVSVPADARRFRLLVDYIDDGERPHARLPPRRHFSATRRRRRGTAMLSRTSRVGDAMRKKRRGEADGQLRVAQRVNHIVDTRAKQGPGWRVPQAPRAFRRSAGPANRSLAPTWAVPSPAALAQMKCRPREFGRIRAIRWRTGRCPAPVPSRRPGAVEVLLVGQRRRQHRVRRRRGSRPPHPRCEGRCSRLSQRPRSRVRGHWSCPRDAPRTCVSSSNWSVRRPGPRDGRRHAGQNGVPCGKQTLMRLSRSARSSA